jgi:hypothetical protein
MPDQSRWRAPCEIRTWIDHELAASRTAADPWTALGRAHIVSQPWAWQHTRVHLRMLVVAVRTLDRSEVVGQLVRLVVAGPGSLAGRYPSGNTGRTTMRLTETAPVPPDLKHLIESSRS